MAKADKKLPVESEPVGIEALVPTMRLGDVIRRPRQEVSRTYQVVNGIFQEHRDACERQVSPSGDVFLLTPQVVVRSDQNKSISVYAQKEDSYYRGEEIAKVQFGTRMQGRRPVLDMPYYLIVNGNITAPGFSINTTGEFVNDFSGDTPQFMYVDELGKIADSTLKIIESDKQHKRSRRIAKGIGLAVVTVLGSIGYGIYDHFHSQHVEARQHVETFDSRHIALKGIALSLNGETLQFVLPMDNPGLDMGAIPNLSDGDTWVSPRRINLATGECLELTPNLAPNEALVVAKSPANTDDIVAVMKNGVVHLCSLDQIVTGSGNSQEIVSDKIAIQKVTR